VLCRSSPPAGFPDDLKYICQRYEGSFRYATLYDTRNRIPLYSAYTIPEKGCNGTQPSRRDNWFIEPEVRHIFYILEAENHGFMTTVVSLGMLDSWKTFVMDTHRHAAITYMFITL